MILSLIIIAICLIVLFALGTSHRMIEVSRTRRADRENNQLRNDCIKNKEKLNEQ